MHILILPSNYPNSYLPQKTVFYADYARALREQGHEVGVLALTPIPVRIVLQQKRMDFGLRELVGDDFTVWLYQYPSPPKSPTLDRLLRRGLLRRLLPGYIQRKGMPDLVHAHGLRGGETALDCKRLWDLPYIFSEHSPEYYFAGDSALSRRLFRVCAEAQERLAVSPQFASYLQASVQIPFKSLPNPVDTGFFHPPPARRARERLFTFINIADLKENKNQAMLIRAFARAYAGNEDYRLLIGGQGAEYSRLASLIQQLGLQGQVRLLGRLNREELRSWLWESDCFVLSSRKETFGVVLIEAMACGLPVIAVASHGPASIVTSSKLGRLVDCDLQSLVQAMLEVPGEEYDSLAIRGHVQNNYSLLRIGEQLDTMYDRALSHHLQTAV